MSKIIFIDETESFIVKSIGKELAKRGFDYSTIPWDADEVQKNVEAGDIVIAYVDEDSQMSAALQYMRDMGDHLKFFLAGQSDDIDEVVKEYDLKELAGKFCRPIKANEVAKKIAVAAGSDPMAQRKHILAVDDSGTMLTTIQEWLGGDYRVSIVNSAMNALTFLSKNIPDLILLDYEMPGCSGPQLLEMLRADTRTAEIPVIFLTGKDDPENTRLVLALKPAGYLLKTMPKEYIIEQIAVFFSKMK